MASHAAHGTSEKEIPAPNTGAIWKTFWILLILTAIEFVIAFTMPANTLRVAIFCGMTIVKAFYIVGEFMHLKHEVKSLIWMVLIPTIFVVWLLVALIYEGGHLY
ncbi:MAG: cytochrome C oxidase subunit IV family protein [Aquirufa sp.]|jgi:cytochrome c oxidase subunit IV|uniref:Cytochrome C oxidase subunit IV family protein n=1 Tax=Aquirufa novilacunae TaxID=3139305 RepID=A0ABW8T0N6_9BACT